ncbi:MAG: hypothetical protein K2Y22_08025 [Candidatus Obscuribacterales bacterium]|nr:hypothetical protein [Candidatus Obscuribacterales bacterium]
MPKLTDKQLQQRKLEMAARSRAAVAKKELVQFRLEADQIVKLFEIAAKNEIHMGTMLRQWVNERIAYEETGSGTSLYTDKQENRGSSAGFVVKEPTTEQLYINNKLERGINLLEQRIAKLEEKSRNKKTKT